MYIVGLTCKISDAVKHILIYRTVDCVYMITAIYFKDG